MKTTKVKTFLGKIFDILTNRTLFSSLYLIVAILWYFPTLGGIMDYPKKLLFIWGIALIGYDLLTKRLSLRGKGAIWLVLLSVMYVVTILMNMDRLYSGVKHLIYNSILLFVVYPFNTQTDKNTYKKWFVHLNDIIIAIGFVAALISVGMYAAQYSLIFTRGETQLAIGIYYNRLHGVYTSANVGSLFSVVCLCLTVINYALDKSHFLKFKWFHLANIIIQFLYYSATLSNGGYLALVAGITAATVVLVFPFLQKRVKAVWAVCLSVLILATSLLALEGATYVSRKVMVSLPGVVDTLFPDTPAQPGEDDPDKTPDKEKPDKPIVLERVEGDDDITNRRTTIWEAGIALLKDNPLFGVAEADIYEDDTLIADVDESKLTELNISELKRVDGYMHNAIIQIVVYSGIIGLLLFVIFAVNAAIGYVAALVKFRRSEAYPLLASVFVLLVVLVSQMAAEAHMLFCRQDLFAILFWLYLGYGMYSIDAENHKQTDEALFVCDTPYQVVNAINLAQLHDSADIYIYDQFSTAKSVAENLKATNIFRNVVLVKRYKSLQGAANKLLTLFRVFAPEYTLKKHLDRKLFKTDYGTVYVSFFTPFIDSVRLSNPQATFVQYEDGVGSYYIDDLENAFRSGLFKWINKFLLNDKMSYKIDTLYLNHPECYGGQNFQTVAAMPKWESSDVLETVFDYQGNRLYADNRFVYLTQPLGETVMGEQASVVENEILAAIKDSVVLRVHPRQDKEVYAGYTIDGVRNLWEIECARQITDEHILIGAFSTAQFTPKMLFDKEPTVIFTYKLFDGLFENADTTVEKLRAMYRQPEKIVVVNDVNELQTVLSACGVNDAK